MASCSQSAFLSPSRWILDDDIRRSFEVQVSDYHDFYRPEIRNTIIKLTIVVIGMIKSQPKTLDMALSNARYLARVKRLYRLIEDGLVSVTSLYRAIFSYVQQKSFLNRQVELIHASSLRDLQSKHNEIVDLFFYIICDCAYDRRMIAVKSPLEWVLDKEIYAAHGKPDLIDPVTQRRIHETVLEVLFACRLGIQPKRAASDFHTVYYLLDRFQKRLGVFKPSIQKDPLKDCYGASEDREAHLAEAVVFPYFLDRKILKPPVSAETLRELNTQELNEVVSCDIHLENQRLI